MAAAASRPEMPTFSYAQAAKGFSASLTPPPPKPSSDQQRTDATTAQQSSLVPVNGSHSSTSAPAELHPRGEAAPVDVAIDSGSKASSLPTAKPVLSGTSSPSVGSTSASTIPKEDDASVTHNGTSESTWDKQSQVSVAIEQPSIRDDVKNESSSDDPPTVANVTTPSKESKELKAAPIPTVNVWQVRREAHEAKAKATAEAFKSISATMAKNTIPGKASNSHPASETPDQSKAASRKKSVPENHVEGGPSHGKERRRNDATKFRDEVPGFRKTSNRPARTAEESNEIPPPPVADAIAWPTPQTALGEEKKKGQEKTGEKSERIEKSLGNKTHGNQKWTPVPYVPTAVFNTPLPSGARRGGRSGRGGAREGGRGGAHPTGTHSPSETNTNANALAHAFKVPNSQPVSGVTPKSSTVVDHSRNEVVSHKTNSVPAATPRRTTSTDASSQQEPKKLSSSFDRPRGEFRPKAPEDTSASAAGTNGAQPAILETSLKPHREAKYVGRNPEPGVSHRSTEHSSRGGNVQADGPNAPRHSSNHERRQDGQPKSADHTREIPPFAPRERDFMRDRGDYQRDRDHPRERGDSRPERGRGGYRGRGGHSYGTSQTPHYSNSQPSQHSFVPQKSYSMNERQRSQPQGYQNGIQSQNSNPRVSLRSPSLPNSAGLYNPYPLPELNTMYSYPQVQPGPMTAMPYQAYMEPFSLMSMIQMQLEYYFSVDNLCKDLFLRRHMDSQGYVILTFIASFKRIKNLTEDFELLRHCCRNLRNVDYHFGDDGVDRLRPREKWEQWVLNLDQRDQSAQTAGPLPAKSHAFGHGITVNGVPAFQDPLDKANHSHSPALTNGLPFDQNQIPNHSINGHSEPQTSQISLSSTAPEFTPHALVIPPNVNANCKHTLRLSVKII